jgi:hypothetical protein
MEAVWTVRVAWKKWNKPSDGLTVALIDGGEVHRDMLWQYALIATALIIGVLLAFPLAICICAGLGWVLMTFDRLTPAAQSATSVKCDAGMASARHIQLDAEPVSFTCAGPAIAGGSGPTMIGVGAMPLTRILIGHLQSRPCRSTRKLRFDGWRFRCQRPFLDWSGQRPKATVEAQPEYGECRVDARGQLVLF